MAKKRAKVDPSLFGGTDLFTKTEPDEKQERERQRQRRRLTRRATYDITPELKDAVSTRATRLGIPASQLAMFLLADSLQRYDAGAVDPKPFLVESNSPRFRNNLAFGDWYWLMGDNE
jgi:hypothetical protein